MWHSEPEDPDLDPDPDPNFVEMLDPEWIRNPVFFV